MKKIHFIFLSLVLSGCGAMGFGNSNSTTTVFNNSNDRITVTGTGGGEVRIEPNTRADVASRHPLTITSNNDDCVTSYMPRKVNVTATILNVIPGGLLGPIPLVIDLANGTMFNSPKNFHYTCLGQ